MSATQDIADVWLLPKFIEFNQIYPDIQVNLMADDYLSDLVEQRMDVAIRVTTPSHDSNLGGRALGQESLRLFSSPAYSQQRELTDSLEELVHWDWVVLHQISPDGKVALQQGKHKVVLKPLISRKTNAPILQ